MVVINRLCMMLVKGRTGALREKAIKTGASKIYLEDLKEFVTDYIFPMVKAGAIYEQVPIRNLDRPSIIAKKIEIAEKGR